MAGSQTWRTYVDDYGNRFSYESSKHYHNGGAYDSVFGVAQFSEVRTGNYPLLPPDVEPRYAVLHLTYVNDEGRGFVSKPLYKARKIRIIVGNPLAFRNMVSPDFQYVYFTSPGETLPSAWNPTYISGERRTLRNSLSARYE